MELAWISGELPAPWASPLRTPTEFAGLPLSAVGWSVTSPNPWVSWSSSVGREWCVGGVPGNPALDTPSQGTAAPSIQAVVTLNLTSNANLSFLLAGLLDNNSTVANGHLGVNGYFVDITNQLPTLGLNPVVLSVLANSSQPDSGVFGTPCSLCVPALPGAAPLRALGLHPHDLFSFFSGLWNSFAGVLTEVFTHLSTLVHALVGIVWNGLIAAEMFFAHLPQGLAHYAMVVVHGVVSGLKAVGGILLHGLQVLLAFIIKKVKQLFNDALQPFYNLRNSFAQSVLNALDPTGPEAVWNALSGSLFLLGITVATVIQVAIGVMTAVTFGAGSILTSIIVGLVLSFGVTALLVILPTLISPGTAMVNSCQSFSQNFLSQPSQAGNWTTWADAFGFWQVGTSNVVAFQELRVAWAGEGSMFDFATQTAAFAFGLLADAFVFYANYLYGTHDTPDAITTTNNAIVVGAVSVILEVPSLIHSEDKTLDGVILGMDTLAWGISAAELKSGY